MLHACMGDDRRHIRYEYTRIPGEITCPFVLKSMGQFLCDDNYFTVRDGLEECILIYTLSGTGLIQHLGVCREVSPGDLVVLDCRSYHDYRTKPGNEWGFFWVHFAGPAAFEYTSFFNREQFAAVHMGEEQFGAYSRRLVELAEQKEQIAELGISLALTELITQAVYTRNERRGQGAAGQEAVARAVAFAEQNYKKPITLDQMARAAMLSRYYFIKVFGQVMGLTPHRFLLQVRVNEAKKLLIATRMPVFAVAEACGFCDAKNFIRHFKQIAGSTPLEFRRRETQWMPG